MVFSLEKRPLGVAHVSSVHELDNSVSSRTRIHNSDTEIPVGAGNAKELLPMSNLPQAADPGLFEELLSAAFSLLYYLKFVPNLRKIRWFLSRNSPNEFPVHFPLDTPVLTRKFVG